MEFRGACDLFVAVLLCVVLGAAAQTTDTSTTTAIPTTTTPHMTEVTTMTTTYTSQPSDTEVTSLVPPFKPPKWPTDVPIGQWNVTEPGKKDPCLMAHFGLVLVVPYETVTGAVFNGTMAIPSTATANGTCNSLSLSWPATSNASGPTDHLTMTFTQELTYQGENKVVDKAVYRPATLTAMLTADEEHFPGAANSGKPIQMTVDHPWNYMTAAVNKSYRCDYEWMLVANSTTPPVKVTDNRNNSGIFAFRNVQIQPYMPSTPGNRFSTPEVCNKDRPEGKTSSRVVPITVGCALGAIVVIVIVAYLLGRRRRQRQYGSV